MLVGVLVCVCVGVLVLVECSVCVLGVVRESCLCLGVCVCVGVVCSV